ncbi:amidase [Pararobbsia alpina]|uniref:amidase n=1 Tax=Pararobbsia alpina TaxID=621374 RepID=UPI0039A46D0E
MSFATARALIDALQSRKVSAVELFDDAVARIERHDGQINAVVVRDFERARQSAVDADAAIARGERRPLLGLPMTVKESFDVIGMPKTWGLPGTGSVKASDEAVAVQRLRQAGAVIIGKSNISTMLSDWQSYNAVYGVTNNPWDLARTPGGSSGGSAAVLAAGFVPLELGSDIGGSLRVPAHCCGIYSHKPTHGLIPLRGAAPPGVPTLSIGVDPDLVVAGPMARSAGDLALALDVLAGPDDAEAIAYRLSLPAPRHTRLADFKVFVFDDHPMMPLSDEVRTATQRFRERLEHAGCTVSSKSDLLPDLETVMRTFGQRLLGFIGGRMPPQQYEAIRARVAGLAKTDTSDAAMEQRNLVLSHRDWLEADSARTGVLHQWRQFFKQWDVVVCPILPVPAYRHDHSDMSTRTLEIDGTPYPYTIQAVWQCVATLPGLPSTAFPVGLGASGLPIGLQAIGPYLEDRTPIAFAELVEQAFGGFVPPPAFSQV